MLKIKLARTGRRNDPHFRVVVAEDRSKVTGKTVDVLGSYTPTDPKNQLLIDQGRYSDWLQKGAQPTETIRRLVTKQLK